MLLLFVGGREDDLSMRIWLFFKSRNKLLVAAQSPESWLHKELLGLRLWLAACIVQLGVEMGSFLAANWWKPGLFPKQEHVLPKHQEKQDIGTVLCTL